MTLTRFFPFPIAVSRKLAARIQEPRNSGTFYAEEATLHEMRLVIGEEGSVAAGQLVRFYLLVDLSDGVIADVKFQAFGSPCLIGAADAACELLLRKSYAQAGRITADLLDKHLRDKTDEPAFPKEAASVVNQVLDAIEKGVEQCSDIPHHDVYIESPVALDRGEGTPYPGWATLSLREQIAVVEDVIAREIRPYIELDEGGIEVADIVGGKEIRIIYQGSCTSCYSAVGATLNSIQQILRAHVDPNIVVIPDPDSLNLF